MGAVSEMMDDDQRDDGTDGHPAGEEGKICSRLEVGSQPKSKDGSDLKGGGVSRGDYWESMSK